MKYNPKILRPQTAPDHIQPHRLWAYVCLEVDLSGPEHTHMADCRTCMDVMRLCLRSSTFGAVLRVLEKQNGQG